MMRVLSEDFPLVLGCHGAGPNEPRFHPKEPLRFPSVAVPARVAT